MQPHPHSHARRRSAGRRKTPGGPLSVRARNLIWTVGGDHTIKVDIDDAALGMDRARCLWEAMKIGGAQRAGALDDVMLYSIKKGYTGADNALLQPLISLCLDGAFYEQLAAERPGTTALRREAYEHVIEHDTARLASSPVGQLEHALMMLSLDPERAMTAALARAARMIASLSGADPHTIIRIADEIYNTFLDPSYAKDAVSLEEVLAVQVSDMEADGFLRDLDRDAYIKEMLLRASMLESQEDETDESEDREELLSERFELKADRSALEEYTTLVFGESALTQADDAELNALSCVGIHSGRRVHVTRGLLDGAPRGDIHYKLSEKHARHNEIAYYSRHRVAKLNIHSLADALRRSLMRRAEPEIISSHRGTIASHRAWMIGRIENARYFDLRVQGDDSPFVVDVLVDGSGSQARRQSRVALQAYVLSAALSLADIPHRVSSYCSLFDCTALQILRDFDDPPSSDMRIFRYRAQGSNRDGLAVRAASISLARRTEEHKMMIILSDGRPNDITARADDTSLPYTDTLAIEDTAREVRRVRDRGIPVLGVFAGFEEDLQAERRIFGKDFAYIRTIATFARVVGAYMIRCIDDDA